MVSTEVCWEFVGINLGNDAKRESILDFGISRNCRERTAVCLNSTTDRTGKSESERG